MVRIMTMAGLYVMIKRFEEAEYYLLRAMEMNPIGRRGYEGLMPFPLHGNG